MALIHLLEDDVAFAQSVQDVLERAHHEVACFSAPHALFYQITKAPPRCVLIDWMLPEMAGVDVLRRLSQQMAGSVGLMMLTAIDDEPSVVQALEAGADDYIVKPCPRSVLRARVEALLRRLRPESATLSQRIEADPYALDFAQRSVTLHGQVVSLTRREFDLAWVLFCNPSRLFTRRELLDAVWGRDCNFESHNVAQHVSAIRRKLDLARHGFRLLATHSIGYRLEWPESVSPQPER